MNRAPTGDPFAGHRFFVDPASLVGDRVELTGGQARQIARVLRLRAGERIVLLDGSGREWDVELRLVTPARIEAAVCAVQTGAGEPRLAITLYQAVVARERFELVLQKGTEVGVAAFVPTWCERSLATRGDAIDERRLERWRRIVQEAAEQAGRGRVPRVRAPLRLGDALAEATGAGATLVAWEGERSRSIRSALDELLASRPERLSLFIGPIGGLAPSEIAAAERLGALTASLGPRILRTETAGPVLAALALYEAGELGPPDESESSSTEARFQSDQSNASS